MRGSKAEPVGCAAGAPAACDGAVAADPGREEPPVSVEVEDAAVPE